MNFEDLTPIYTVHFETNAVLRFDLLEAAISERVDLKWNMSFRLWGIHAVRVRLQAHKASQMGLAFNLSKKGASFAWSLIDSGFGLNTVGDLACGLIEGTAASVAAATVRASRETDDDAEWLTELRQLIAKETPKAVWHFQRTHEAFCRCQDRRKALLANRKRETGEGLNGKTIRLEWNAPRNLIQVL